MLFEIIKLAFKSIFLNKLRAFLTMLGIIIGVASVVSLSAIGSGVTKYIEDQFNALGANTIYVIPGGTEKKDQQQQNFAALLGTSTTVSLAMDDVKTVARLRGIVSSATPLTEGLGLIAYKENKETTTLVGTSTDILDSINLKIDKGTIFSDTDVNAKKQYVFLGADLATNLFAQSNPVGKKIKIGEKTFTVVGVAAKKSSGFGGPPFDKWAYIPYTIAFDLNNNNKISEIIVKVKDPSQIEEAKTAIEKAIVARGRLKANEFTVLDQQEILDTINQILNVLTIGLSGIAAISLVVGGIGIMNIMLVSVSERTKEIGLRKALGAPPKLILLQFLFEALFLSIVGGLIGLLVSWLLVLALNSYFPAIITLNAVMLALGVSFSVGLIFGVAPARSAARLSPIEALRYE